LSTRGSMFRRIKLTTPIASSNVNFRKVSTFQSAPLLSIWEGLTSQIPVRNLEFSHM
jgi:hypothetical protein